MDPLEKLHKSVPAERWRAVLVFAIVMVMLDGFDLQVLGLLAPEMARDWNVAISDFAAAFSASLFGSMAGSMAAGLLVRRWGTKPVLVGAVLLFSLATLATFRVSGPALLIVLRAFVGLGIGATLPIVVGMVMEAAPARFRAVLVAATLCGQPVGAMLGALLCSVLVPAFGWRAGFISGGVAPLLLLPALLFIRTGEGGRGEREAKGAGVGAIFANGLGRTTALVWGSCFFSVMLIYLVINWLPAGMRANGYSLGASMTAISLFNLGGVVGAIIIGVLIDRLGPLRVMPAAFALAALVLFSLASLTDAPAVLMTAVFLAGAAGYGGTMASGPLCAAIYPSALRVTGTGWSMGVGRLGAAAGPLGAGVVLAAGAPIESLYYGAGLAAVAAGLFLLAIRGAGLHGARKISVELAG